MDIEVDDALLVEHKETGMGYWQVTSTVNGQRHSHAFPHSVFHWRVAEYGLDPDDVHGLLEAILYEPHLNHHPNDPQSLGDAETIADARTAYLTRIAELKGTGGIRERKRRETETRMIDPGKIRGKVIADADTDPDGPLDMIKRRVTIDPDTVDVMRTVVTEQRNRHRATRD